MGILETIKKPNFRYEYKTKMNSSHIHEYFITSPKMYQT